VSFDGAAFEINNVTNTTAKRPLTVFANNRRSEGAYGQFGTSTASDPTKMRLYRLKIYENGEEIKDFVPCVKRGYLLTPNASNETCVAGLMETHSGEFHTNENLLEHPFAYGDEGIMTVEDDPYVALARNVFAIGVETNSFIETGYWFTPQSRIEMDYALLLPDNPSFDGVWMPSPLSARIVDSDGKKREVSMLVNWAKNTASPYTKQYCMWVCIGSETNVLEQTTDPFYPYHPLESSYGIRRKAVFDKNSFRMVTAGYTNFVVTVSDANEMKANTTDGSGNWKGATVRIGAGYAEDNNDKLRRFTPMKVYGLKIYEDNALAFDYRPFISNGVAYLRDEIGKGVIRTRTMTRKSNNPPSPEAPDAATTNIMMRAGGDIALFNFAAEREKDAYLEFDGTNGVGHVVNTGFTVMKDDRIEIDFALWSSVPGTGKNRQIIFDQWNSSGNIWTRLEIRDPGLFYCQFENKPSTIDSTYTGWKYVDGQLPENERRRFVLDGQGGTLKIYTPDGRLVCSETLRGVRTNTGGNTILYIGGHKEDGGNYAAKMRLYGFKVYRDGKLIRNYVPYRNADGSECGLYDTEGEYDPATGAYFPVTGGKVEGGDWRDVPGEKFLLSGSQTSRYYTRKLKFVAAGAVDYKWYRDGELIPELAGKETNYVTWVRMASPYKGERYTVVPVYELFGQTYEGTPSSTQIINCPMGMTTTFK
jgi:hypothetical protein